jgi:hypothetical protein
MYGAQPFDLRVVYNALMVYRPDFFRNAQGIAGHLLRGWSIAPLFTAQSGAPLPVLISGGTGNDCQSFGEMNCTSVGTGNHENAIEIAPISPGNSAHYGVSSTGAGSVGNTAVGGSGINMFADPNSVFSDFRRLILGVDTSGGGSGVLRGFATWNVDVAVTKDIRFTERLGATLNFQFTNVLNHFQPANPTLNIDNPGSFGVVTDQANTPRQMEFGLRIFF